MKILKRILSFITIIFLINSIIISCSKKSVSTVSAETNPVKVAVFLLDFTDDFISEIRQNLEAIQKENPNKVEYTFFDANSNQDIQDEQLDKVLNERTADLLLLNIVNRGKAQAGELQGKMLIDAWKSSRQFIDRNDDKIMQYVMLEGESDNTEAIQRTKYSVSTIEKAGIKTQQIALKICNWREDLAYNDTKSLLEKYKKGN